MVYFSLQFFMSITTLKKGGMMTALQGRVLFTARCAPDLVFN